MTFWRRLAARWRGAADDEGAMRADSLRRLRRRRGRGLAVVSVLPPAESGIAHCTISTYARAPFPVDLYAAPASLRDYRAGVEDSRLLGSRAEAFALSALTQGRLRRGYAGEVFTFGNSPHNAPAYAALKARGSGGVAFAHLHEPYLIDLCKAVAKAEGRPLADWLRARYRGGFAGLDAAVANEDAGAFLAARCLGARALFAGLDVAGFVVNSEAARDLLLGDWPELDPARVHVLFHPVFAPARSARTARENVRIAGFGVPGWLKHTPMLIEAFRLLRARAERPMELWLAGYDVDYWTREHGYADEPGLVRVDAPEARAFEALMGDVDLAVQLRARTLGESSGVVAQLLALGTPVLASRLGAFAEFGEAVAPAPEPLNAETLAEAIARELATPAGARAAAARDYVARRTPERFCAELMRLIGSARDQNASGM